MKKIIALTNLWTRLHCKAIHWRGLHRSKFQTLQFCIGGGKLLWFSSFTYAFVLLLILSPDSYLYDVFQRCDSAWFFMCGKAWMNGMVPYVDFADSKGPLLWLIYGVGYLLSPRSFIGVFWLSVVAYAATFVLAHRLARLLSSDRVALGVLALLPVALLFKGVHNEVRSEDFCYPLVMANLYLSFLAVKKKEQRLFWPGFGIGACLTACLLIKWNIAAMLSGTAVVILVVSAKRKDLQGIYGGLLGLCSVAIPFLAYFILQGNFSAFIQEYFLNTYATVSHIMQPQQLLERGMRFSVTKFLLFAIMLLGFVTCCHRYKLSWWLCIIPLPFTILIAISQYSYYYSIIMPLMVIVCIVVLDLFLQYVTMGHKAFAAACTLIVLAGIIYNFHDSYPLRFKQNKAHQAYYDMEAKMACVNNPRLTVYTMENGIGIVAHALPANKYWALQNGHTTAMEKEREGALIARKADFIIVNRANRADKSDISEEKLSQHGYTFCGITVNEVGRPNLYVYRKH